MKPKHIIIPLILATFVIMGIGLYLFDRGVQNIANKKADFELSADELFNEFDTDEATANEKYVEKIVVVEGVIEQIEKTDSTAILTLSAEDAMIGGVNCDMQYVTSIENWKEGDKVSVKCICQGYLMNVIMNQCVKNK